jgi:hypothetical protein
MGADLSTQRQHLIMAAAARQGEAKCLIQWLAWPTSAAGPATSHQAHEVLAARLEGMARPDVTAIALAEPALWEAPLGDVYTFEMAIGPEQQPSAQFAEVDLVFVFASQGFTHEITARVFDGDPAPFRRLTRELVHAVRVPPPSPLAPAPPREVSVLAVRWQRVAGGGAALALVIVVVVWIRRRRRARHTARHMV